MAKIYAIANQKGGVGKSTTAQSLAAGLYDLGKKVLLIDLDPQSNLSVLCGATTDDKDSNVVTMLEILVGEQPLSAGIQNKDKYDIIPASMFLASIDGRLTDPISKPFKLQETLKGKVNKYDIVIVDTPPALGTITANAIIAADEVIMPAQADILSLQGVSQLYNTIETARGYCNKKLKVTGILLTRYNERTRLSKDLTLMFENAAAQMSSKVFKNKIRDNTAVKEAQAKGEDIFTYDNKCNAAKDYRALINEIFVEEVK